MIDDDTKLKNLAKRLEDYFIKYGSAIIAYSGGVDSTLLSYVAHIVLKERMIAVLADSPSLSRKEYRFAVGFAEKNKIPIKVVKTQEMENPLYLSNQGNRCYYCKQDMFEKIKVLRENMTTSSENASWPIFYGANLDDLGDHRPGMQAAKEANIVAPYIDLNMGKDDIRAVSAYYKLEVAEKPAMPCLSSRIAYGQKVTHEKLNQVEQAEGFLYAMGFLELRVRHHGDVARVEVPPQDLSKLLENREHISNKFHDLGFSFVTMDLDGLRSGSLNEILRNE